MAFDATSTADDVLAGIDLTNRTVVVTGASGGIGLEAARAFAAHGATVVAAARSEAKLADAIATVRESHPGANVEPLLLDLASLASVRAAAAELADRHPVVHIVVDNAGVMATPFGRTADGFEMQFGTNHLGHFLFTNLLQPQLVAGGADGGARVVSLSSAGHSMGTVDFVDPNFDHRAYDPFVAYGQSKTANILFAVALDARLAGRGVRAFAVHPGGIHTELGRYMTKEDIALLAGRIRERNAAVGSSGAPSFRWKTVSQGAATSVWAATSTDLDDVGGRYCEDCSLALPAEHTVGSGYQAYAVDPDAARRLWTLSEDLVGERFP